jgi:hypothetical protein
MGNMNNHKNLLMTVLFSAFVLCNTTQAMKRELEIYDQKVDDKSQFFVLTQAAGIIEYGENKISLLMDVTETDQSLPVMTVAKQRNNRSNTIQPYICDRDDCKYSTKHQDRIKNHWAMHDMNETYGRKMYRCNTCHYIIDEERIIQRHTETHNNEKKHHCNLCNDWFKTDRSMKRHLATSQKHQEALLRYQNNVIF